MLKSYACGKKHSMEITMPLFLKRFMAVAQQGLSNHHADLFAAVTGHREPRYEDIGARHRNRAYRPAEIYIPRSFC